MKLIVLSDNRSHCPEWKTEHGLCIYVETDRHKILLDTGASDLFVQNAQKAGIDLHKIDYVFISHGHADHMGGLPYFLTWNTKARIILSSAIRHQSYFSKRDGLHSLSTSIDFNAYHDRFIWVEKSFSLDDDLHIYSNQSTRYAKPLGNKNLFRKENEGALLPDHFDHELILTIGKERLLVYTGCAHNGLLNILETVKANTSAPISWVIGGFHLVSAQKSVFHESEEDIIAIGNALKSTYPATRFFTGHCTSDEAFATLSAILNQSPNEPPQTTPEFVRPNLPLEQFYGGLEKWLNKNE